MMEVFDGTACNLGEGPLWHPIRNQLFWFDILKNRMLTQQTGKTRVWDFKENVSAAGWLNRETLLIAGETALFRFDPDTGKQTHICALEADNPITRSNDGRADPQGGFWIGTMGKGAETEAGAIYRYYRGELRLLFPNISIPNAICFAPDGRTAYFGDSSLNTIWKQRLNEADGWPVGTRDVFADLAADRLVPDGAVVDAEGNVWNAQWGASRIAVYDPQGQLLRTVSCAASQVTCPALGGDGFQTLFATSASTDLSPDQAAKEADAGKTFVEAVEATGQAEHRVIL